ncbi:MAG: tetratricopeptide repeat protein [Paracoccaceae bacterium]
MSIRRWKTILRPSHVYEKAIELNPQYYEAYNNLGCSIRAK